MRITAAKRSPFSSDPTSALMWNSITINTGRPRSFAIAPGKDSALTVNVLNVLAALVWEGDSASGARSATELTRWGTAPHDSSASLLHSAAYFTLGLLALNHGDTAGVERARASLRSLRAPPATPWALSTSTVQEKLLGAHLAVARKAPHARSRLNELDSLLIDSPANFDFAINIGNLLVSRLWESVGDDQRAWSTVTRTFLGPGGSASRRCVSWRAHAPASGSAAEMMQSLHFAPLWRSEQRRTGRISERLQRPARHWRDSRPIRASASRVEQPIDLHRARFGPPSFPNELRPEFAFAARRALRARFDRNSPSMPAQEIGLS